MKQYQHFYQNISQSSSHAQVTSSAKVYAKIISEIEPNKDQSTEFQEVFDLIKQLEESFQQYQANNSELSHIDCLKNFHHGYHFA